MSKLKNLKDNAKKIGQSVVATTMLTTGILGITPNDITTKPITPAEQSQVSVMGKVKSTQTVNANSQNRIQEMLWLDEDHLIINGEILSNEEATRKYPNDLEKLERFIETSRHEKERELHPIDELPKDGWQTLPPEAMQEIEKRMQNFNLDDYLPNQDKNTEPTMER
mgnify:CR=1 FL=1